MSPKMRLDLSTFKQIVVLTGAGISAESGVATFRDSNGLWEQHRIEDVAAPEAFERDPILVWTFYSLRRRAARMVAPNAAHIALAKFAARLEKPSAVISSVAPRRSSSPSRKMEPAKFTLVTQNVDMLHERAAAAVGASHPVTMHGTLGVSRCVDCAKEFEDHTVWFDENGPTKKPDPPGGRANAVSGLAPNSDVPIKTDSRGLPLCPSCNGLLRPHIVWFGEMPLHLDLIYTSLSSCDLFLTIGTSGQVYPAAGFLEQAKMAGAVTACLNKEPLPQQTMVDFYFEGPATSTVPAVFRLG